MEDGVEAPHVLGGEAVHAAALEVADCLCCYTD